MNLLSGVLVILEAEESNGPTGSHLTMTVIRKYRSEVVLEMNAVATVLRKEAVSAIIGADLY